MIYIRIYGKRLCFLGVNSKESKNFILKEGMFMISNQVLQSTVDGLKGISKIDFIVADTEGKILATTFQNHEIGNEEIVSFVKSQADSQAVRGFIRYMMKIDWSMF